MKTFRNKTESERWRERTDTATAGLTGIHIGTVSAYLKGNDVYKVNLKLKGKREDVKCVWAAGFFSNLLGFNANFVPPLGTEVIILLTDESKGYIIGTPPHIQFITHNGVNRRVTTGGKKEIEEHQYAKQNIFRKLWQFFNKNEKNSSDTYAYHGQPAGDMAEGEFDFSNAMGVGLELMRHFASIKGGDFAKVEAFLIDDMVRIISHTFRHFSAFGDYEIYNDGGRLNVSWRGTTNDWELHGKDEPNAVRAEKDGDKIIDIEKDKYVNDAKWRFQSYVGFLGDFINLFVTDKLEVTDPEQHLKCSGKGRMHVNEDGAVLLQTTSEIVLERVCRIPVPLQQYAPNDPDGDGHESNGELPFPEDKEPIKCWDWDKSGGVPKSFWCVYQLRDYGRWFSNYYTKARFQQLKQDFRVPSESEVPRPHRVDSEEYDKREANQGIPDTYMDVYATIRIHRDGSISITDGYDNAITMSKSGLSLSSHTNLHLEAAGSINMVAGKDINAVAKKSVDLNALGGGLSFRGENFIQQFTKGGILLEAEGHPQGRIYANDDIDHPDQPQESRARIDGVFINAKRGNVRVVANQDMGLRSYGHQIFCGGMQVYKSQSLMILQDELVLRPGLVMAKGLIWSDKMMTKDLYSGNLVKGIFEIPSHMMGTLHDAEDRLIGPSDNEKIAALFDFTKEISSGFNKRSWDGEFRHRTRQEYNTDGDEAESPKSLHETLTQQSLRLQAQNPQLVTNGYTDFPLSEMVKLSGRGAAWPGESKDHYTWDGMGDQKLWDPSSKDTFDNFGSPLTLQDINLKSLV